ncbi:hypothetical protein ACFQ2M_29045 [Kitasatospora saccharophila]|uniref:hypothetical protein n=1 Tax=Kitasatospora saccharophila TaxID=407973 RepID=UPI00363B1181
MVWSMLSWSVVRAERSCTGMAVLVSAVCMTLVALGVDIAATLSSGWCSICPAQLAPLSKGCAKHTFE